MHQLKDTLHLAEGPSPGGHGVARGPRELLSGLWRPLKPTQGAGMGGKGHNSLSPLHEISGVRHKLYIKVGAGFRIRVRGYWVITSSATGYRTPKCGAHKAKITTKKTLPSC